MLEVNPVRQAYQRTQVSGHVTSAATRVNSRLDYTPTAEHIDSRGILQIDSLVCVCVLHYVTIF